MCGDIERRAWPRLRISPATLALLLFSLRLMADGSKTLPGHVPAVVAHLRAASPLPATNRLNLAIGLPLRNQSELTAFLGRLYDPASPEYRHYLTPGEFTSRFGPSEQDYQSVIAFARQNHWQITQTNANRLVLDVNGAAADINQALNVTLKVYHHPTEARDFYAPDSNPAVPESLPIADISGLNSFSRPKPRFHQAFASAKTSRAAPLVGSGPAGTLIGYDFRKAYLPGVTLTGAGQSVGLVEFSGYYLQDVAAYVGEAGLPGVPLQNVAVDNSNGAKDPDGNIEAALDIEMVECMAPNLSSIITFDGGTNGIPNDVLEALVADSSVRQISCSWGWGGGPTNTTDGLFEELAAQGQSFFTAAGDNDAFTVGADSANGVDNPALDNVPSSNPYVTVVGGSALVTASPGGAWSAESVWNSGLNGDGSYLGTAGGISSYYGIPAWQTNISMTKNGGSTTFRNVPDVAANAINAYNTFNNGTSGSNYVGTSFAAPLWGGLAALINEQAAAVGRPAMGFANPGIYAIGQGAAYATCFHDVTNGNNEWPGSPDSYTAVPGYDLCTGWGAPAGQNLINALATFEPLTFSQTNGFGAAGYVGGPFNTNHETLNLYNAGGAPLQWSAAYVPNWLTVSPASGTLAGFSGVTVTISLNAVASALFAGNYPATISFTDLNSGSGKNFSFGLQTIEGMALLPAGGVAGSGLVGGPFNVASTNLTITNLGATALGWTLGAHPAWLTMTPTNGTLAPARAATVTASLNANAATLAGGVYNTTVSINDLAGGTSPAIPVTLNVGQSIAQNGGFETGTFTNWTLTGTASTGGPVYNAIESAASQYSTVVHSGSYGALLGDTQVATLSQNLPTVPGQTYLLSCWLENPVSGSGEEFLVNWITSPGVTNQVYFNGNPPVLAWTNLNFVLQATGTNTELEFGAENVPYFFGLDDISVTPIPNPAIQNLARAGGSLTMTLFSVPGISYQLLYATNLAPANWMPLSTNTATATTLTLTNNPGTNKLRFYRIRQLP